MSNEGAWVLKLEVRDCDRLAPVCRSETIAEMVDLMGRNAVDWVVYQSHAVAEQHLAAFPLLGGGPTQLATVRLGVESATLAVLAGIYCGRLPGLVLPAEAEIQVRDFVHRGIPLTEQLAVIRQGQALLVDTLMRACVELCPAEQQGRQLMLLSRMAFEYAEAYAAQVETVFEAEQRRYAESSMFSREAALRSLLSGEATDLLDLGRRLQYDISHRVHWAMIFSRDMPGPWDESLIVAARDAMATVNARQTLLIPQGHAILWAFGNSTSAFGDWAWEPSESIHVSLGDPGVDAVGLRTSHRQALEAHRMSSVAQQESGVTHYRDVNLRHLLLVDKALAAEFVAYELGDLAADDKPTEELRETLATYLKTHNTQATAAALFLARNTVTYRLRKAETLLGRAIAERPLQTSVALHLMGVSKPSTL
jgi:PucR C-terminal helix-turn-helix domain